MVSVDASCPPLCLLPLLLPASSNPPMRRTAASDLKERKSNRMTSSEGAPPLPPSVPPRSTRTIRFDELPDWAKDNHFILRGYRTADTYWLCASSIFSHIHNETVNIVSGSSSAFSLCSSAPFAVESPRRIASCARSTRSLLRTLGEDPDQHGSIRLAGTIHPHSTLPFAGASERHVPRQRSCLHLLPECRHLLRVLGDVPYPPLSFYARVALLESAGVSPATSPLRRRLPVDDSYIGIVVLISGTFVPLVHYGWYCASSLEAHRLTLSNEPLAGAPRLRDFYLAMISLASACALLFSFLVES